MLMWISAEEILEERTAGGEDDFVGLDLVILTGKSHVKEVPIVPQLPECYTHIGLKIIPF